MDQETNTYDDVTPLQTGDAADIVLFHGSRRLFETFLPSEKKNSPGIWFTTNRDYVSCMGNHVYTCRVRADNVRRLGPGDDLMLVSEARDAGIGAQIMDYGIVETPDNGVPPREAYVIVTDVEDIEIAEIYDRANDAVLYAAPLPSMASAGLSP